MEATAVKARTDARVSQNHGSSPPPALRNHLPDERLSLTHKFSVGGHEGYITVGLFPDRQPGEIFITMAKEGSTVSGLMNSFAQAISIGLQHGVPLKLFCEKFSYTRFEPSGWTGNPEIGQASSVMDYIFRWLRSKFIPTEQATNCPPNVFSSSGVNSKEPPETAFPRPAIQTGSTEAPSCRNCGSLMRANGACHVCSNCGASNGCS